MSENTGASRSITRSDLVRASSSPDIRLFYTIDSPLHKAEKTPIILLSNSLAASTPLWNEFVEAFANEYTIVRYDARFHGQSPLSSTKDYDYERGHTIDDLAEDVIKLLDGLNIQRVDAFIGLSIGAAVGVALAAKYPERFDSFVIVGTRANAKDGDNAGYDARIKYGRENSSRALGQQSVQRWFGEQWIQHHPDKALFLLDVVGGQSIEGFVASVQALRKLDLWPAAEEISKRSEGNKLLFVVGAEDADPVVEDTKALAERTGSEAVVVEDAGHMVNVQAPEQFHDIVRRRIEQTIS
ncbi:alpha/beta-hydrolase [Rhizodiscina lignyota]|uniref:Alpha/beta-hydrolase n=1 Tax=Rhizodiscina lignyota TaxID=1504668 RepID=A0A9P4IAV9_9PEZI|nr:alpha/beta-hydrolase [Rhizodiscina lignyota]